MLELAPSGVEHVDGDGVVELAVYGAPGELPELNEGEAEVGGIRVTVSATEVGDDWEERWKRFHVPVLVGEGVPGIRHPCQIPERLYVRPPWEPPVDRPEVIDLIIDPGRAFGTGSHPTTRLCLELLLELDPHEGPLCDLGCGSGVLSIAAARLGFGSVSALDFDLLAVQATGANARANGVTLERVEPFDLRTRPAPAARVVVANLMRPLLLEVAARMESYPRTLIISGLLDEEADEVAAAFAPLRERRRLSEGGWSALLLGAHMA